jgi:D-alanine-D-alanine ligase
MRDIKRGACLQPRHSREGMQPIMNRLSKSSSQSQIHLTSSTEDDLSSEEPPSHRPRPRAGSRSQTKPPASPRKPLISTRPSIVGQSTLATAFLEPAALALPIMEAVYPALQYDLLHSLDVVVLYSLALGLERGRPEDKIADEETEFVASSVAAALQGMVHSVRLIPVWDNLPEAMRQLDPRKHVIFNLVESLGGRTFSEPDGPRHLEDMGFIYTGGDELAIQRSLNKLVTKELLESASLLTPQYQVFHQDDHQPLHVPLPAIVKPIAEGSSFGIHQDSLVSDPEQLHARVHYCLETYRQPALVEEYIAGREINVALWGNAHPTVLPISEVCFDWTQDPLKKFVTFDCKWIADSVEYRGSRGLCPALLSLEEQMRIEEVAIKAFQALQARGYARVDMRLRDGIPFILEVNVNPDLAPDAGFFRSASTAGYSYDEMIAYILQLAVTHRP